jgi:DNA-binding NtrC family response regulator
MRVLIADDDPQMRGWLLRAMDVMGHRAEAVVDAGALLLRVAEFDPGAVLSDISLPGCDGITAGLWLQRTRPRCRVVLMSGDRERAEAAREAGFSSVLDKPFSFEELTTALSPSSA